LEDTNQLKVVWKRLLRDLSSLPRAISLMAAVFAFSALGTVIPQNKPYSYYIENYPIDGDKVLGFLSYDLLLNLEFDHIYTAWYFYVSLAWLAASLAACTWTRQWPAVKVAQRWRFQTSPSSVVKQAQERGVAEVLPNARAADLGALLAQRGYQVFVQAGGLYAFKGLAGRIGPIGVHAALLLILGGTAYSGIGGFKGTVMIPEGQDFRVADSIRAVSPLAAPPTAANNIMRVNEFKIDYRPDGSVAQFYSDLSMLDTTSSSSGGDPSPSGARELLRKTISVNDPFRYGGLTMYQTDWSLSSVRIKVAGVAGTNSAASSSGSSDAARGADSGIATLVGETIELPFGSLEGRPGISGRLWGSYLPVAAMTLQEAEQGKAPRGVSILARDPQSVIFYDSRGQFVGVRRPGSGKPIEVEGVQLVAEQIIGATGLEIKSDPGVPWVYAGFGGLMVTTLVSYLSHSQVWALQEEGYLYVAGRSNRARIQFRDEMDQVLESVPEYPPAQQQGQAAAASQN